MTSSLNTSSAAQELINTNFIPASPVISYMQNQACPALSNHATTFVRITSQNDSN